MIPPATGVETSPLIGILLGLIQGLTEFLPVSSSGHLVLAQELLGAPRPGIALEIVLHAATLLAVLWTLRLEVAAVAGEAWGALAGLPRRGPAALREARGVWLLILATIPAALAGLLLRGGIEAAFESPRAAAGCLVVTGLLLLATRRLRLRPRELGGRPALAMGLAQALALLPGISRSGWTVGAGLILGVASAKAVRFSFLMSVPAVLGSLILTLPDVVRDAGGHGSLFLAAAFLAAFLSGVAAIRWMLRIVARGRLHYFGFYCLAAGIAGWVLLG